MENWGFVPVTSAEHAMAVVLALRSKNRSVAEVPHGSGRHVDDGHKVRFIVAIETTNAVQD